MFMISGAELNNRPICLRNSFTQVQHSLTKHCKLTGMLPFEAGAHTLGQKRNAANDLPEQAPHKWRRVMPVGEDETHSRNSPSEGTSATASLTSRSLPILDVIV